MNFIEEELTNEPVFFNPEYEDKRTFALHQVEVGHNIQKIDYFNKKLTLNIVVTFVNKINNDIIAKANTSKVISVELRDNKTPNDFNGLYSCVVGMTSDVKILLSKEIPPQRIETMIPLITDYEIREVVDAVFSKLKE